MLGTENQDLSLIQIVNSIDIGILYPFKRGIISSKVVDYKLKLSPQLQVREAFGLSK